MVSTIYVALCALLIVALSWRVILLRRQHRVSLGDGGNKQLQKAIAAQQNATEYIPVTLLLLAMLELNAAPVMLFHGLGILFMLARLMHAYGVVNRFRLRVLGMQLTFTAMIALAVSNLVYLPYAKLF